MNSKGFTLIETILVLCIAFIISSVTFTILTPQKNIYQKQLFLSQLQTDLYYAQQYAISHQTEITVVFDSQQNMYYMREKFIGGTIIKRVYPKNISVQANTLPLTFRLLVDGNVNQFGSLLIYIDGKVYRFTILLGKGRFYIVEV